MFCSFLNDKNISLIKKMNPLHLRNIYSHYENGNYQEYIDKMTDHIESEGSVDIYNMLMILSSETFLNISNNAELEKILESYILFLQEGVSFLNDNDLDHNGAVKGLMNFASVILDNFSDFEIDEIEKVFDLIYTLIDIFKQINIELDIAIHNKLLTLFEKSKKHVSQKKHVDSDICEVGNTKTKSSQEIYPKGSELYLSHKWLTLISKIDTLRSLVKSDRIFETAVVYNDLQKLLADFDPKEYFPEIFFPMYKDIAKHIRSIHENIDSFSNTVQWSIANKMYQIDHKSFLNDLKKMPENGLSMNQKHEHFYNSQERDEYQMDKNKQIESDDIIHKQDDDFF